MRNSILTFLFVSIFFTACDDNDSAPVTDFERSAMLQNLGENIILPRLTELQNEVDELNTAVETFSQDLDENSLVQAREAWRNAAEDWQSVSAFGFGPGELTLGPIGQVLGTFPVSEASIESAIDEQDFSLNNFRRDVRGFYAIEYLLFGPETASTLQEWYQSSQGADRLAYLNAVTENLKSNIDQVVSEWNEGYLTSFVESDGTSAGSATAQLFNAFSQDYEVLKNFKVGLPAGKRPGQSQPEPEKVEAYYSRMSLQLMEEHFEALVALWEGQDGLGFREYLQTVEGGPELVNATQEQITQVEQAMENLPDLPLSQIIEQNPEAVEELHSELQRLTRFFKSDMASLLGIAITYDSGDGD